MKSVLFILSLCLLLVSCGNSSETELSAQAVVQDTLRYGTTPFTFPKLSANAESIVENWPIYEDFTSQASSMANLSIEELNEKATILLAHSDSLAVKIPDTLATQAVKSRLIIINTRINLLKQEAAKGKVDAEKIENHLAEVNGAIKNFIVQINEKFQKDGIDMQRIDNEKKELEKQQKFLDSVRLAELADQKNKK